MAETVIAVVSGPNLNLLGTREPEIYGSFSLDDLLARVAAKAKELDPEIRIEHVQSNSEGALIDAIQSLSSRAQALIINPAAYTHTSVAIRDALAAFKGPKVEVHLSNIFAREEFRHRSFISAVVDGTITGLGPVGYELALIAVVERLKKE